MHYRILSLLDYYNQIWRECQTYMPELKHSFTHAEQIQNDKKLDTQFNELNSIVEIKNRLIARDHFLKSIQKLLGNLMGFEQDQLDVLFSQDSIKAAVLFINKAREYDPELSNSDIYQAARNVWAMTGLQYMLHLPVELTPSMFAYSLLYPYTDNYLDDPSIPAKTKLSFNDRFGKRINGEKVKPKNDYEKRVFEMIGMIEGQWERSQYPLVYESLIAIHIAQIKSMRLLEKNKSSDTIDVISISLEKGGASVVADGFLVKGQLSQEQEMFLFGYGAFLQLLDDLQDVQQDLVNGQQSIFSQVVNNKKLDELTSKTFNFSKQVMASIDNMNMNGRTEIMKKIMSNTAESMLVDAANRSKQFFTSSYIQNLENYSPLRFDRVLEKRKKITQHQNQMNTWFELFTEKSYKSHTAKETVPEPIQV